MASSTTKSKSPTTKTIVSTVGSIAAVVIVARTVALDYMPPDFRHFLYLSFRNFINKFSPHFTMVIYESNEIYNAVKTFLAARMMSTNQIHRVKVCRNRNDKKINVGMEINEEFTDVFKGVKFKWTLVSKKPSKQYYNHDKGPVDQLSFELMFHRKHKDLALKEYILFILDYSEMKKEQDKTLKIFTIDKNKRSSNLRDNMWTSMNLNHPANFRTLAMDNDIKEMVVKDLDRFVKRKDYYRKVGKAWKRGYLLYGPPGTGKSSLIAAMANYLKFDIYDLELTEVKSNSELRRFLVTTTNRSVLVVEDIDCSVELHDRADEEAVKVLARKYQWQDNNKITLSGFLNSIDGLWSSCGDERIIIFTTNRKEKLDPALLRPGRMDVHIHMSYCSPSGFRLLASNYLGIPQHTLFGEIEDLIREVEITPAEVAEQLLKDDDPEIAISGLIEYFNVKKKENEEAKSKAKKEEELATKEMEK